ncbi:MAG: hypothetical protein J5856_01425 [Lachnospiraceae bacterium]|nr:hypothetical protein [Lachnospiraceae bacterium]
MNKQSYLDADMLRKECDECIALLNSDIADIDAVSENIRKVIVEDGFLGEIANALRAELDRYFAIFEMLKEADRLDINDYNVLRNRVSKSYDGDLICSSFERARRDRDDYQGKADNERRLAASFNTERITVLPNGTIIKEYISNPHEASAAMYQGMADDCQAEMNMWQAKMDEFDAIEAETSGLFAAGESKRSLAKAGLVAINKTYISQS